METGCKNIQLCITVLKLAIAPEVIGLLFLFPMVYGTLQLIEASVLIVLFRCNERFVLKQGGESHSWILKMQMRHKTTLWSQI